MKLKCSFDLSRWQPHISTRLDNIMNHRGTGADYVVSGFNKSAVKGLADYTVRFEVSPRNMNLGR